MVNRDMKEAKNYDVLDIFADTTKLQANCSILMVAV